MLNLQWRTPEQDFLHQRVMQDARKLDKDQLLEIFAEIHSQYLLRNHLFSRLASWCAHNGVLLPSFQELLEPKSADHPFE